MVCSDNDILLGTKVIAMILANVAEFGTGRGNEPGKNGAICMKEKKAHKNTKIRHRTHWVWWPTTSS